MVFKTAYGEYLIKSITVHAKVFEYQNKLIIYAYCIWAILNNNQTLIETVTQLMVFYGVYVGLNYI